MVIATHLIYSTYGFWLPNDPRGSWSDYVRSYELSLLGRATKVTTRRSIANAVHDRALREQQKAALQYDPVVFTQEQIECVGRGFARAVEESRYELLACAIMPDHVHQVVLRHSNKAEQIIGHFKARATQQLVAENLHPFVQHRGENGKLPPVWVSRGWKVFLNTQAEIERAVKYVEENPVKAAMPRQRWPFVVAR